MARHGAWRQVKGFLAVLQRTSASRFHDRRRLAVHFVEIIHASRMTPDLPSGGVGRARFWCDDLSKTSYQDGASTSRRVGAKANSRRGNLGRRKYSLEGGPFRSGAGHAAQLLPAARAADLCQSAHKSDPRSASKIDRLWRHRIACKRAPRRSWSGLRRRRARGGVRFGLSSASCG